MGRTLEFFFDVGSPASYLAWTQLPALAAQTDASLQWRPMLLGGVFQATGNASPATVPAKGAYVFQDLARYARRYGVPLQRNPFFPINTLMLMRAATGFVMHQPDRLQTFLAAVFDAIWVQGLNLGDPMVVGRVLTGVGLDADQVLAWCSDADVKAQLKNTTDEAVRRGVFGAPTCFVGDEMFFGQDRLDFIRAALQAPQA